MQLMLTCAEIHTQTCLHATRTSIVRHFFLATSQAEDSASFSCLGEQRAFCKGVQQKEKQFVVAIVLPDNSRDLAVPPEAAACKKKKNTLSVSCLSPLSLLLNHKQKKQQPQKAFSTLIYTVI